MALTCSTSTATLTRSPTSSGFAACGLLEVDARNEAEGTSDQAHKHQPRHGPRRAGRQRARHPADHRHRDEALRDVVARDGKITITIPERIDVSAAALAPAMASPAA